MGCRAGRRRLLLRLRRTRPRRLPRYPRCLRRHSRVLEGRRSPETDTRLPTLLLFPPPCLPLLALLSLRSTPRRPGHSDQTNSIRPPMERTRLRSAAKCPVRRLPSPLRSTTTTPTRRSRTRLRRTCRRSTASGARFSVQAREGRSGSSRGRARTGIPFMPSRSFDPSGWERARRSTRRRLQLSFVSESR